MRAFHGYILCLLLICVTASKRLLAADHPVSYEVAVINKSMTGDWADEREFRKHVKAVFKTEEVLRFKYRGDNALHEWLDEGEPSEVKVICLIDGWTSATITRVDVRGQLKGTALKRAFKVKHGDWKEALAQAKCYTSRAD